MRETGRRRPGRTESRTDGDLDGHHHTIIRPVGRIKNQGVIVKHCQYPPPRGNNIEKAIFSFKSNHKVIDLGVI